MERSPIGQYQTEEGSVSTAVISAVVNGQSLGSAYPGNNGYYYIPMPAGTVGNGAGVLVTMQSAINSDAPPMWAIGGGNAFALTGAPATGPIYAVTEPNLYSNMFTVPTGEMLFSAGPQSVAAALASPAYAPLLASAENGNSTVTSFVNSVTELAIVSSGFSFTVDASASGGLLIQTGSGASITVSAPIALGPGQTLALLSGGSLFIEGPITVTGSGAVIFAAQPITDVSTTGLVFYNGATVDYGATDQGGTFQLNGVNYALIYDLASLDGLISGGQ